ncbi:MAG: hypothetical protein QME52_04790 [Bacteroidota bacterium]|nr:hypothetical protein [Bacteroidota bacterium]
MTSKPKLSPEDYRKILGGVNLIEISLKESKTFVNKDIRSTTDLEIGIRDESHFEQEKEGVINILQRYELDARKPKSKSRYIQISLTFLVRMNCKEPFTEDFFSIYKEVSLQLNTWPFFREFVHSMTSRMNIPPMTLPLLKR